VTPPNAQLSDRIAGHFRPCPPDALGVAVSGGSDSLALLALSNDWRAAGGPALHAVTVDHGLRPGSADEARMVARLCEGWGVPHTTLLWRDRDGGGNLPDRARRARYRLMAGWAHEEGIGCIALGHTLDDQAETFLMRLSRGAGVDGLSAMAPRWDHDGITFARPLLEVGREELRDALRARGLAWIDDPSNDDPVYERARVRRALAVLSPLGIDAPTLSSVAANLADVRDTLYVQVARAAAEIARIEAGDVVVAWAGLAALDPEIARRLLQEAILWISGAGYPPRGRAMTRLVGALSGGKSPTLHGCRFITRAGTVRITREERAVAGHVVPPGAVWDGRWRLTGPDVASARVAALGEAGLRQCPDRRRTALPAASLRASPAVWCGEYLLAAPLAGAGNGWTAKLLPRPSHDFAALIAH